MKILSSLFVMMSVIVLLLMMNEKCVFAKKEHISQRQNVKKSSKQQTYLSCKGRLDICLSTLQLNAQSLKKRCVFLAHEIKADVSLVHLKCIARQKYSGPDGLKAATSDTSKKVYGDACCKTSECALGLHCRPNHLVKNAPQKACLHAMNSLGANQSCSKGFSECKSRFICSKVFTGFRCKSRKRK